MIVAGMATMPSRAATARIAVSSALQFVDRLVLFLDRFDEVPDFARDSKIVVLRSQDLGDLRANGKLAGVSTTSRNDFYICLDDDIRYPKNFAARLKFFLTLFPWPAMVGIHGSVFKQQISSYTRDRRVYVGHHFQRIPRRMDVLATNGCMFRIRDLKPDVTQWKTVNMVDLSMAEAAKAAGVTQYTIPRPRHWIHSLEEFQNDSIFGALVKNDEQQTARVRALLGR
jgi:hypothetical protein